MADFSNGPQTLLADITFDPRLQKAIDEQGFTEATEVQSATLAKSMAGADLMVSAKTGSGKTAAFLLPLLSKMLAEENNEGSTRALILLPTRELALQTLKEFQTFAAFTHVRAGLIIGGEAFKHQMATLRKNPEVIIATPGRLVDHIEKGNTDFTDLEIMILDEADRMLDMGFAEDMNTIADQCRAGRQNLLFSATLNHQGLTKISGILTKPESIEVDSHRGNHSEIVQQRILADDINHKEKLVAAIIKQDEPKKVFIFCKTRAQCEALGYKLQQQELKVDFIHGEIPQSQRKQVMSRFRDGKLHILVATDVAARGLDVADVDMVINFSVAHSGDDHVHRVGRTGRAGQSGKAINLVGHEEWNQMSSIERYLKIRFEVRVIKGLKASYAGPKKLKKSGKAMGAKKKSKLDPKKSGTGKDKKKKTTNKWGKPQTEVKRDGFATLKKKPKA